MKKNIKNVVKIALFLASSVVGINAQQKQREVKISQKEKVCVGAVGIAIAGLVAANVDTGIYTSFFGNFAYLGSIMVLGKLANLIPNLPYDIKNAVTAVDWGAWILPFGAILGNHLKSGDLAEKPYALTYILAGLGVKLSEQAMIAAYGVLKTIYVNQKDDQPEDQSNDNFTKHFRARNN